MKLIRRRHRKRVQTLTPREKFSLHTAILRLERRARLTGHTMAIDSAGGVL